MTDSSSEKPPENLAEPPDRSRTLAAERGPSRSAQLVAACRALAAELPESERLITDPFAEYFVDAKAMDAARANEPLQRVIRLRTRVIDDALLAFAEHHLRPQILLLGAGVDARALRLEVAARFFEVDLPATLAHKESALDRLIGVMPSLTPSQKQSRIVVPVDLGCQPPRAPLVDAGFDADAPAFVVWEGVINYLENGSASATVRDLGELLVSGSQVIADYVENTAYDAGARAKTKAVAGELRSGGEPLRSGLLDFRGTFAEAGFRVIADTAIEDLAARYGLRERPAIYPSRIALLEKE
jgi:methyltransferase (TIGR00027 family)